MKRSAEGPPFEQRGRAVSATLTNRYRVVGRPFDAQTILFEAAPLAWPESSKVPALVAEYIVDQEFPGEAKVWLYEWMPDLLHEFITAPDYEVKGAVGGIFMCIYTDRLVPHWSKWLRPETLEAMYEVSQAHLADRHPHLFVDNQE